MGSRRWITWTAIGVLAVLGIAFGVGTAFKSDRTANDKALTYMGTVGGSSGVQSVGAPDVMPVTPGVVSSDEVAPTVDGGSSVFGERIIRSTSLSIEVPKGRFDEAWNAAIAIAREFGGEVINSNRGTDDVPRPLTEADAPVPAGSIEIRVPTPKLDDATAKLRSSLGKVRSENANSQDVTQEYVDLQSQLRNLRAERSVLLDLFDRARNVRDTLQVQQRLSEVQGQIEQLTGRVKYIESRTDYSVISLNLAEPGALILGTPDEGPSFAKAWDTALEGLVRIGTTLMIAAIWLVPFAVLAAVIMAMLRRKPGSTPQV